VELAEDMTLDRLVALKHPHLELWNRPEARERFLREAKAMAALSHPHILQLFDIGEDNESGHPFLAFEYVDGPTLERGILENGPLPNRVVLELAQQLFGALETAHDQGIVHRDIKPGNILLNLQGQAKLADFGLSHREGSDGLTLAGSFLGTPRYAPPELVRGESLTSSADVYSLGAVLWECLTGKPAFSAADPQATLYRIAHETAPLVTELRADALPLLTEIIRSCMLPIPSERPSALKVRATIATFIEDQSWKSLTLLVSRWLKKEAELEKEEELILSLLWKKLAVEAERHGRKAAASKFRHFSHIPTPEGSDGSQTTATPSSAKPLSPDEVPQPSGRSAKGAASATLRRNQAGVAILLVLIVVFMGWWLVGPKATSENGEPSKSASPLKSTQVSALPPTSSTPSEKLVSSSNQSPAVIEKSNDNTGATPNLPHGALSPIRSKPPSDKATSTPSSPSPNSLTAPSAATPVLASNQAPGLFTVVTRPPLAQVEVNGTPAGNTPFSAPLKLPPGSHQIRLTRKGCYPVDTVVLIRSGEPLEWRRQLETR
jgi:serine/threonine-protein kinase